MVRPGMGDIDTATKHSLRFYTMISRVVGRCACVLRVQELFIFSSNSHLWMKTKENVLFFKWWIVGNVCSVCTFFKCGATLFVDMRVFRVPKWCLWHVIMLIYGMKSMLASGISVPDFPLIHYRDVHLHHTTACIPCVIVQIFPPPEKRSARSLQSSPLKMPKFQLKIPFFKTINAEIYQLTIPLVLDKNVNIS